MAFSQSLWLDAWNKIKKDKLALLCLTVVGIYILVAILVSLGVVASNWSQPVGGSYDPPSLNAIMGTDIFGRDVFRKTLVGTQVALSVGLVTVLISIPIGFIFGAVAGYFGGLIDECIVWFCTTLSSIPGFMLLMSITFFLGKGLFAMYIALGLTSWVGLCRMIRAEVMKHKNRDYVLAAEVVGVGTWGRLLRHILPNVFHIIIIDASLTFQMAIKAEVILSYLGLGVQDQPSWGKMIDDAKLELARDVWWQLGAATVAMFIVLIALNFLGDILRDALDPKLKGRG